MNCQIQTPQKHNRKNGHSQIQFTSMTIYSNQNHMSFYKISSPTKCNIVTICFWKTAGISRILPHKPDFSDTGFIWAIVEECVGSHSISHKTRRCWSATQGTALQYNNRAAVSVCDQVKLAKKYNEREGVFDNITEETSSNFWMCGNWKHQHQWTQLQQWQWRNIRSHGRCYAISK